MKYNYWLLFLLVLAVCWSCNRKSAKTTVKAPGLQDTLSIKYNATLQLPEEELELKFTSIKDDRCPKTVNCFQAGQAKVNIAVTKGSALKNIVLEAKGGCYKMDGSCGDLAYALGYKVQLLGIEPYPMAPKDQKLVENSVLMLVVNK